jgi:hypothetical protein
VAFPKGVSGNPGGRPAEKAFADAVRIAVNREGPDGRKKLMMLAEKLVDAALAGEGWAFQQIGDRLDGKPAQDNSHEVKGEIKVVLRQMLEDDDDE